MNTWSAPVSAEVAHRRASGRRHYNSVRQFRAELRRRRVEELCEKYGLGPGVQAQIARTLGVARSTICHDFALMFHRWNERCPECGQRTRRPHVSQMSEDDLTEWPLDAVAGGHER